MNARVRDRSIEFRRSLFSRSEFRSNRFETSWRPKPIFFKSNKKLSKRFKTNLRLSECTCNSQVSNDRLNSRATCRKSSNVALNSLAYHSLFYNRQLKSREKIKPSYLQFLKLLSRRESRLSSRESRLSSRESRLSRRESRLSRRDSRLARRW